MKNKQSRRVDEISSQLLKVIGKEICKSLTLIISQMIETGIYPENFKIAKITPIHIKRVIKMLYQIIDQFPSCLLCQKYLSA